MGHKRRVPLATLVSVGLSLLLLTTVVSCSRRFPDVPKPNLPPDTHLYLESTRTLRTTTSQQVLHWYGDDPDGLVVGFLYTFDAEAPVPETWGGDTLAGVWTFTTAQSDTFGLRFISQDTTFTFRVAAVDDQSAVDPTPAMQRFPVKNTPPEVEFTLNSDVPETTFTVASFSWRGTDLDGDETIVAYEWALDDTSSADAWHRVPSKVTFLTLREEDGLTEGNHVFYVRAVDLSGSRSKTARMPRTEDKTWHVRKPKSRFLLIDDYAPLDNSAAFYADLLAELLGRFDVWDIKADRNRDNDPDLLPSSAATFTATLELFDRVLWYTDQSPTLEYAQISIPAFLQKGGKIVMSASFPEFFSSQGNPLEFSPVDSLGFTINRVTPGVDLLPQKVELDTLRTSTNVFFVKTLVPKPSSLVLYRLSESSRWQGQPVVAVENADRSFVFFGMPLHKLDGRNTVQSVLRHILEVEFGGTP